MKTKVFFVSPVRMIDAESAKECAAYVMQLEADDYEVHWPIRDTNQKADGVDICEQNTDAIKAADRVDVYWVKGSEGSLYDFGVARALRKPLGNIVKPTIVERPTHKCVEQLLFDWLQESQYYQPENPKMIGSGSMDIVPQGYDHCPMECDQCYCNYNFYTDVPIMRPLAQMEGLIGRINSGFDSGDHKGYVIEATECYPLRYFNTSRPDTDWPAPVMITVNGRNTDGGFYKLEPARCLMGVRVRVNTWNTYNVVDEAVDWYNPMGVPIFLTFMRYYEKHKILNPEDYEFRKHIVNDYWDIKKKARDDIVHRYINDHHVYACGANSDYCRDCHVCEAAFWQTHWRMEWARKVGEL